MRPSEQEATRYLVAWNIHCIVHKNSVKPVSVVRQCIHQRLQVLRYRGAKVHRLFADRMLKVEFSGMQCLARITLQEGYGFGARPLRYNSTTSIGGIAH